MIDLGFLFKINIIYIHLSTGDKCYLIARVW